MACRLACAKLLSEPMINIIDWTLRNKFQWNIDRNSYIFIHENEFENVAHLVSNSMYQSPIRR